MLYRPMKNAGKPQGLSPIILAPLGGNAGRCLGFQLLPPLLELVDPDSQLSRSWVAGLSPTAASRMASSLNSRLYCLYGLRCMVRSSQGKYPLFRASTKRG
jgi:hypothetical protein